MPNYDLGRKLLYWTFGLLPIVAGLDKFTNIIADWSEFLSPAIASLLPMNPESFMILVGIIEIVAGILVLMPKTTKIGAYIVGVWLVLITINLLMSGFYSIAVRDLAMAISVFALAVMTGDRMRNEVA